MIKIYKVIDLIFDIPNPNSHQLFYTNINLKIKFYAITNNLNNFITSIHSSERNSYKQVYRQDRSDLESQIISIGCQSNINRQKEKHIFEEEYLYGKINYYQQFDKQHFQYQRFSQNNLLKLSINQFSITKKTTNPKRPTHLPSKSLNLITTPNNYQQQQLYNNYKLTPNLKTMSQNHLPDEDNFSIEIDPSVFDKPDSQLTQQLYQMARKIAESDRNNQTYRQIKKNKSFQLETLKKNQHDLENQLHQSEQQLPTKKTTQNAPIFAKNPHQKYTQLTTTYNQLTQQQQTLHKNTTNLTKQNNQLQKKLQILQHEYQIMLKQNKYKTNIINKLNQQKQQKLTIIKNHQDKIDTLENQCETTKKKAQDLENQLKQQLKNQKQLKDLIATREHQLHQQQRQHEQTTRKQSQTKRAILKLATTAKTLQSDLQLKLAQGQKLQLIHQSLRQKILTMEHQQKHLEQFITHRKNIINNVKNISARALKQQQLFTKIKQNKITDNQ